MSLMTLQLHVMTMQFNHFNFCSILGSLFMINHASFPTSLLYDIALNTKSWNCISDQSCSNTKHSMTHN